MPDAPTNPQVQRLVDDTAFERYVLSKAVPVRVESAVIGGRYHLDGNRLDATVHVTDTVGMSLPQAVEQLGIRPLAFGAAWKVLDLMLETAFEQAGLTPDKNRARWTITEKVKLARKGKGTITPISTDAEIWNRLLQTYVATEQVRHSLVHRKADVGSSGDIIGSDENGRPFRSLTIAEQEAFCHAVQLAFRAVARDRLTIRGRNRLLWSLDVLAGLTNHPTSGAYQPPEQVPRIAVAVSEPYELDLIHLKERFQVFTPEREWDLLLELEDRTEQIVLHLEQAPAELVRLDIDSLPPWATQLAPS